MLPVLYSPDLANDSRSLAFCDVNGIELPLTMSSGAEFFYQPGIEGLGMAPREVITSSMPEVEGEVIDEIKVGKRSVFLPLFLGSSSSHRDYLRDSAKLRRLFNHRGVDMRKTSGTIELRATSAVDTLYTMRTLRLTYVDGAESGYGTDSEGSHWTSLGLRFVAVQPYWQGDSWATPFVMRPAGVPWFGAFPPQLSEGQALGQDLEVAVPGDAPSWPVITLHGYCSSVEVSASGLYVSLPDGLADGETATVTTDPRNRSVTIDDVDAWDRVDPRTTFASLMPGDQTLNINLGDPSINAYGNVYGYSMWETPW